MFPIVIIQIPDSDIIDILKFTIWSYYNIVNLTIITLFKHIFYLFFILIRYYALKDLVVWNSANNNKTFPIFFINF